MPRTLTIFTIAALAALTASAKVLLTRDDALARISGDRVEVVGRSVTPLMLQMIEALDAFVEIGIGTIG